MAANQVDFKILPSDQFSVYSPQTRSDKVITYFTLLSKLRGDILSVGQEDDPNNIVSAFYSSVGGTQTLHLVKADGSEVTASVPEPTVGTVTSVDLTASTGISVSGGPITTSGSITVTNTAPDQVVVLTGAGTTSISGTYPSFTITSNDQFVGTVTSVGLTMPAAFSVANSPVTASGTLAVTAAGLSSQYIRGDGQLANFPTPGGGGSSVNYYLNGSVSQGTFGGVTYYELSKVPIAGAGTNFTRTSASGDGYIASFITDANDPDQINIPGGNWNLEFYFNSSSSGGSPAFYGELYKVSISNVFTLIASGSVNPESITGGTTVDQYYTSIAVPQTALLSTDRLAIRVYVIVSGKDITLHTENSNFCEVITTFSTGLNSLNGLSDQVQYFAVGTAGTDFAISSSLDTHTFNLPTASATNRGALSSADWTTFNSKEPALTKGNLTEATSAVLTITGGTGAVIGTGTTIQVAQSGVSTSGFLSSTDWNTFNGKQNAITLTTTGSTGAATLIGATLNIPNYADQFVGTVTSVNMSVPTGFAISGNPITTSGTLAVAFDTGYSLPTNASQTTWNTAYNDSITAFAYNTSTAVLTLTQQDAGTLTATVTLQPFTTSNLTEGTNLYYTDTRARLALSAGTGISYDSATGIITNSDRGSSQNIFKNIAVAGQSTIVADVNDDTLTVVAGSGVTITTNDTTDTLTISATGSGGTVTSVDLTAGTGISVSGGPITGSGSITVNNTAPDQTVVLTGGTGITTSGTYPSFTVTNSAPDQTVVLTAGTGITTSGTYPSFTVTNSAPDQTVALTAGTGISISGTYPSFTITNTSAGGGTITGSGTTNYVPKWTSASAIGDSVIYDDGTNVGINTTTPTLNTSGRVLHINAPSNQASIVHFTNATTGALANDGLIVGRWDDGINYLFTYENEPLHFGTNTSIRMVITAAGNVGIGNTAPNQKLELSVGNAVTGGLRINYDAVATSEGMDITYLNSGNTTTSFDSRYNSDSAVMQFRMKTAATAVNAMTILGNGNIGINQTAPSEKLHVTGNIRVTGAYYDSSNAAGTSGQILSSTGTGTSWIAAPSGGITGSGTTNYVTKWTSGTAVGDSSIYDNGSVVSVGTASPYSGLSTRLYVGYAQNNSVVNQNEFISVGAAGGSTNQAGINFLIYNAAYGGRIYTDDNTVRGLAFDVLEGGTFYNAISITRTTSPNVGIGTTAPQKPLEVISGVNNFVSVGVSQMSVGNWSGIHFGYREANSFYRKSAIVFERTDLTANDAQGKIHILNGPQGGSGSATLADAKITIAENGNVGIGSTSPISKVQSQIGANGSALLLVNAAGGGGAYVDLDFNTYTPYQSGYANPGASIRVIDDGAYSGHITFRTKGAAIGAAQSERMRIEASTGNVGIGTTGPTTSLDVRKTIPASSGSSPVVRVGNDSGDWGNYSMIEASNVPDARSVRFGAYLGASAYSQGGFAVVTGDNGAIGTNPSIKFFVRHDGNVGIGTTAPNSKLSVNGGDFEFNRGTGALGNNYFVINKGTSNDGGFLLRRDNTNDWQIVNVSTTGNLTFYAYGAASEVLTILRSNGNVGINNTNASYKLDISGDARILSGSLGVGVAPNATDGRIDASNDIVAFSSSDLRLKENIKPIENALEKVKSLTGVEFDWKPELKHAHGYEGHDTGVIAQEVQEVMPTAIRTNDTGYLAVRYEKLIGLLIEANKELAARVEELESKFK